MLHVQICSPVDTTDTILSAIGDDRLITSLAVSRGVALSPPGDIVSFDVPREAANSVLLKLTGTHIHDVGTVRIEPVSTWISRPAYEAMVAAPGAGADAVVWPEVTQRAYTDSELTWTYLMFMTMATLIAAIAIGLDSQILVIGAMVLGPEFGAIAALGVGLVRRRRTLLAQALRTLVLGFVGAILVTTAATLLARSLGWISLDALLRPRPGTQFIYTPDKWSLIVSIIAGTAGVLSLTSAKSGGLSGVFISVTTIPAAANLAVALAFLEWSEVRGSALQLVINITGMALAGWAVLAFQNTIVARSEKSARLRRRRAHDDPRRT